VGQGLRLKNWNSSLHTDCQEQWSPENYTSSGSWRDVMGNGCDLATFLAFDNYTSVKLWCDISGWVIGVCQYQLTCSNLYFVNVRTYQLGYNSWSLVWKIIFHMQYSIWRYE
jgi:hypothetical protein